MMRLSLIFMLMLLLFTGGCGSGFGEGAAAGAAAVGALEGIDDAYQQQADEIQARYDKALADLDSAADETEKLAAQAKANALAEQLSDTQKKLVSVELTKQAAGTKWSDPASVAGFSNAAALALMAWYLRKKQKA